MQDYRNKKPDYTNQNYYIATVLTVIAFLLGIIIYNQIELIRIQNEAYSKLYSIGYFAKFLEEISLTLDDINKFPW